MGATFTVQCDQPLPHAPEWVHLVPEGKARTRDGRVFVNDTPQAVIAAFQGGEIDLPIDYEHQNDTPAAKQSGPIPAAGWIKELAERTDGIWGRVEWTDRARAMITAREYRFLSPSLIVEKDTQRVARIKGAALVHNPALHITALAAQEDTMDNPNAFMAKLAKLLDMDDDVTEEDLLSALADRLKADGTPDPTKYAPVEAMREAMSNRNREVATYREDRLSRKVERAIDQGYILPAGKNWAMDLCRKDEASFDAFLTSTLPPYAHLLRESHTRATPPGGRDGAPAVQAEIALLSQQLGIDPERLTED